MKRIGPFFILLLVFLVWTFPHRLLVERVLRDIAATRGLSATVKSVAPAWPPGYRLEQLEIESGPYRLTTARTWIVFGLRGIRRVNADLCGGSLEAFLETSPKGRVVRAWFRNVDPVECLRLDSLTVGGKFDGSIEIDGRRNRRTAPESMIESLGPGRLTLDGRDGRISGLLPAPGTVRGAGRKNAERRPIGDWSFSNLHVEAESDARSVRISNTTANAEGVEWRLDSLDLSPSRGGSTRIAGTLRARRADESTRSKAVLGILPKAAEDSDGWRHYRISGSLDSPRLVGLP